MKLNKELFNQITNHFDTVGYHENTAV